MLGSHVTSLVSKGHRASVGLGIRCCYTKLFHSKSSLWIWACGFGQRCAKCVMLPICLLNRLNLLFTYSVYRSRPCKVKKRLFIFAIYIYRLPFALAMMISMTQHNISMVIYPTTTSHDRCSQKLVNFKGCSTYPG